MRNTRNIYFAESIVAFISIAFSIPFITDRSHHPIASLSEVRDRDPIAFNPTKISLIANHWHYDSS